jgi:hypothetical protein
MDTKSLTIFAFILTLCCLRGSSKICASRIQYLHAMLNKTELNLLEMMQWNRKCTKWIRDQIKSDQGLSYNQ